MNNFWRCLKFKKKQLPDVSPVTNNYGIIKGMIQSIKVNSDGMHTKRMHLKHKFPHFNFTVTINNLFYTANINVQSRNPQSPNLKIYYTNNPLQDLKNTNVFLETQKLLPGVYNNIKQNLALDYLRGNYFSLEQLIIPTEPGKSFEKDVLTDILNKYMSEGQQNKDYIVLWGSLYDDNGHKGIHNIHMNQGNPILLKENGIWQDGGFMICSDQEIKFVCFLTFSEQCLVTNEKGNCK